MKEHNYYICYCIPYFYFQQVLDKRLNDRVDNMMKQGLVQELSTFHTRYNEERIQDDK